jgi:4-alpha-glucanotransferase
MHLAQRRSGVLLHVTSLPGPHGIGDFGPGAYHFVDWLADSGQSLWQWLPTTPIGPGNSPYQSVSAFAGSPLMVGLEPLVESGWLAPPVFPAGGFDARRVDFDAVVPWREAQLRSAFEGFLARAEAADLLGWAAWRVAHADWLDDYVLFMALERAHGGQPWWTWGDNLRRREPQALAAARHAHRGEMDFWSFVQWNFDRQCNALKAYANQRGVSLMGDLPIFIAHHSADCWARPELYFLGEDSLPTVVAGVPPDELSELGQRWGNPLYRWDAMAADRYRWWTARVQRALQGADALRIDHFIGFSRYWEIAAESPGAQVGRWMPGPGKALFDAIAQALGPLPIVAEDLGLLTPEVIALRDSCGFPGMKIVTFAFGGDGSHEFLPHQHGTHCVAYPGTHDNDTLRGWWAAASERERAYAAAYCGGSDHDIHWAMIRTICNSPAAMAIFPMQDLLGLDTMHRMNLPGTVGGDNWCWRFEWPMVGPDPGRRLGALAAASGRAHIGLLRLPAP